VICSTLLRVRPDVFLVDHAPLAMKGELKLALEPAQRPTAGAADTPPSDAHREGLWESASIWAANA
jgi:hypothetical protein